jgi:DNA invertase Pin-like site-specific DNA recombinase
MKYVVYYRVSTKQQGKSGLGLEAQKMQVTNFLKDGDTILNEFTDIDSGKNDNRVNLKKAIDHAKKNDAKLLIAKLDRLSRNVSFIFQLRDSKVDFVCCDLPDANTLTIGIFATMAQHEREIISKRTKAALEVRKARGFKLGTPKNLTNEGRSKAWQTTRDKATNNENNKRAAMMICELYGTMSLQAIADKMNDGGFKTSTGKAFHKTSVSRIYKRYCLSK